MRLAGNLMHPGDGHMVGTFEVVSVFLHLLRFILVLSLGQGCPTLILEVCCPAGLQSEPKKAHLVQPMEISLSCCLVKAVVPSWS